MKNPSFIRRMGRPWRITTIAAAVTAGLAALSIVLDTGGPRSRDLALLIGAPTLYLLLPATVAGFVVALVMRIHRRRIGRHRQRQASRAGRMPV